MMSGGGGSGSTPTTPNSTTVPPITPIMSFIPPSGGAGMRYPLYATVQQLQGSPLIYSPAMFGNIGLPWRPLGPTSQASPSSTTQSSSPSTTVQNTMVNVPNLTSLNQIQNAGLVYPIGMPMLTTTPKQLLASTQEGKKNTEVSETGKRRNEHTYQESDLKRPRLSESIPHSPSLTSSSPSSHPSTPTHPHKSSQQQQPSLQRPPVIKIISYNPGQPMILPTNTGNPRVTMPQAIVLPVSNVHTGTPQTLPKATVPNAVLSPSQEHKPKQHQYGIIGQFISGRGEVISGANAEASLLAQSVSSAGSKITQVATHLPPPSLPDNLHIVLLKCFGHLPDGILNHPNITVSSQLQDLYRQSYYATSNFDPLSPESACSLTICYLNSLRHGENISVENLRTMMHYAQLGEAEWIQYYKKHKKMSESTYVQSQLMHMSRMAVYPTQGKVRVRTSHQNLGEGLILTLYDLFIANNYSMAKQNVPEYIVVMAIHPSSTIDFCVLVIEPLQVLRIREAKLLIGLDSKRRKQQRNLPTALPKTPLFLTKLNIPKEVLVSLLHYHKSLGGNVQVPFYCTKSVAFRSLDSSCRSPQVPISVAEALAPTSSHVIEHKPSGPFQDQCNIAVFLLQKILSSFNSKIEQFQQIDFRVLCPPDASFVSQTVSDIISSGIMDHLECLQTPSKSERVHCTSTSASASNRVSGSQTELSPEAEAERRIVCCNLQVDSPRFRNLIEDLEHNQDTLFLVVVENAHLTTRIASRSFPSSTGKAATDPNLLSISDCPALLKNFNNCVFLNVSSYPYSLQSNHSLVSPLTNQIHWPMKQQPSGEDRSALQFCSAATFQTSSASNDTDQEIADFGVRFREDTSFEELFHQAVTKLNHSSTLSKSISSIRAQLLLDQYVLSLLATLGQAPPTQCGSPLPETLALVNQVVQTPLLNQRGHGKMLIIRSHDVSIGRQLYSKLKATRDTLGLQFRFEVIFDDGSHLLSLSEHFAKRISKLRGCDMDARHVTSYRELENLPCIVVLAGSLRAGLSFPKSLHCVDLRLCFPIGQVTRLCYEYDTSLLNGYYNNPQRRTGSVTDTGSRAHKDRVESMDTSCVEDSDSVFEASGNLTSTSASYSQSIPRPIPLVKSIDKHVRTSSSSSSRKSSSFEDASSKVPKKSGQSSSRRSSIRGEAIVINWHPSTTETTKESVSSTSSRESTTDSQSGPANDIHSPIQADNDIHDCNFSSSGTVTVTIDPPEDGNHFYSSDTKCEAASHMGASGSIIPFTISPVADGDDNEDLYGNMDELESDSEEEGEDEMKNPAKVCLLSRPYFHIWSSQNRQQHLLLPPAPGINWFGGHRRPPLYDPDPQQQSHHYYKWSKPASGHDRTYLDSVSRETSQGAGRRFLLSGPPQVGKTGAWLLLMRLLHDHLRSSQGVEVETTPFQTSIFLQNETGTEPSCTRGQNAALAIGKLSRPTNAKHSKIVTLEYLTEHLCNGVDSKSEVKLKPPVVVIPLPVQTRTVAESSTSLTTHYARPITTRTTVSISTSPFMAYDFTHSCNDCAQYKHTQVNSNVHTVEIESYLPSETGPPVTIKWQIPSSQSKRCVFVPSADQARPILERLKLRTMNPIKDKGSSIKTPIFIPTVSRDLTGLFNLFHSGYQQLEVLVTVESQFEKYCKAWPNLIVMALPDSEAMGLGSTYHLIQRFARHNFQLNQSTTSHSVWPMVAIMSDNIVMWKRIVRDNDRHENISMAEALLSLEQTADCAQYAALSVLPWSEELTEATLASSCLTDFDLSHDFIMLNLPQTADFSYNQFSFNSSDIGFNLELKAAGLKTLLRKDLTIVRKHLPTGGNLYPLHSLATGLSTDIDKVVISLHHDSSCHLPYPGPYLMEHYLLHKSPSLFPYAHEPNFPVLVVDNYISLGPQIHVTMVNSETLHLSSPSKNESCANVKRNTLVQDEVRFGGLLLYLCEGKLESEQLDRLNFVPGACLCLVTRDCKTLVREVARLDLEEKWKFRLRDEYQTACADIMKPLFFLIGRFEG